MIASPSLLMGLGKITGNATITKNSVRNTKTRTIKRIDFGDRNIFEVLRFLENMSNQSFCFMHVGWALLPDLHLGWALLPNKSTIERARVPILRKKLHGQECPFYIR